MIYGSSLFEINDTYSHKKNFSYDISITDKINIKLNVNDIYYQNGVTGNSQNRKKNVVVPS